MKIMQLCEIGSMTAENLSQNIQAYAVQAPKWIKFWNRFICAQVHSVSFHKYMRVPHYSKCTCTIKCTIRTLPLRFASAVHVRNGSHWVCDDWLKNKDHNILYIWGDSVIITSCHEENGNCCMASDTSNAHAQLYMGWAVLWRFVSSFL